MGSLRWWSSTVGRQEQAGICQVLETSLLWASGTLQEKCQEWQWVSGSVLTWAQTCQAYCHGLVKLIHVCSPHLTHALVPLHALTLSVLFLAFSCCSSCEIWLAEFSRSLVRLAWSRCTSSTSWAISRSLAANSTSRLDRVSTSMACSWEGQSNDETALALGEELGDLSICK